MKTHHFHSKLLCQKVMLRQIEWRVQNGPITKSGILPVTTLFFWKFCSSLRTSFKELSWCTKDPNAHIRIFRKHWSLILGYFFPVSILKVNKSVYVAKSRQRYYRTLNNILLHVPNHALKAVFVLNYKIIKNTNSSYYTRLTWFFAHSPLFFNDNMDKGSE